MPDPLNAFVDLPHIPVPHAQAGPLAGLSLAVKDIFDVAGYRTGWGSPHRFAEAAIANESAPAVQALLDAGAHFAGKTQTDELAFSLMGINAHFAPPVNPAAPERVTGGSSSGSAAAVAGGLCDIALGSDTGGSIRAPASFCGLIGLRATHGRIPLQGVMRLAPSFDTVGWFARDIETYEKVAEVFFDIDRAAPHPPAGTFSLQAARRTLAATPTPPSPRPSRGEGKGEGQSPKLRPLRLPVLEELLLSDSARSEFRRMLDLVANVLGPPRERALNQDINDLYWCFRKLQAYEAWAVHGPWISEKDRQLGPGVKERFEFGSSISCEAATEETKRRNSFRAEFAEMLGDDGLLVLPTTPNAAPLRDAAFEDLQAYRERALKMLCLSGLSGFPQITLPLGRVDGAPFGISLLGPANSDMTLIRLGRRIVEAGERE